MSPDANNPASGAEQIERDGIVEDLSSEIGSDDASKVKGGFDPQPDPPRLLDPIQISAKFIRQ